MTVSSCIFQAKDALRLHKYVQKETAVEETFANLLEDGMPSPLSPISYGILKFCELSHCLADLSIHTVIVCDGSF